MQNNTNNHKSAKNVSPLEINYTDRAIDIVLSADIEQLQKILAILFS